MIEPATLRKRFLTFGLAVPLLLAISFLIQPDDASARPKARRSRVAEVEPAENATLLTGAVESASTGVIHMRGRRFDVSRARFVGADGKPSSASFVQHGIKVALTLDAGRVVEVRIYPPMARE